MIMALPLQNEKFLLETLHDIIQYCTNPIKINQQQVAGYINKKRIKYMQKTKEINKNRKNINDIIEELNFNFHFILSKLNRLYIKRV